MKRTQEDAEKTRQSIMDAAIKLFIQNGYIRTTLDDISKEANITRGAIYWHFKNKEDLFIAIADSIFQETTEKINIFLQDGTTLREKLTRTITNLCLWYLDNPHIREKRKITISQLTSRDQTLLRKIFSSIYPDDTLPDNSEFLHFIMKKMEPTVLKISPELIKIDRMILEENFITMLAFTEGLLGIIIRSPEVMNRETIENIVNRFMEGFFHSFNYKKILEAK